MREAPSATLAFADEALMLKYNTAYRRVHCPHTVLGTKYLGPKFVINFFLVDQYLGRTMKMSLVTKTQNSGRRSPGYYLVIVGVDFEGTRIKMHTTVRKR